jgi:hypothetical protein
MDSCAIVSQPERDSDLRSFVWMGIDVTTIKMAELTQSLFPGQYHIGVKFEKSEKLAISLLRSSVIPKPLSWHLSVLWNVR